jgi:hypothetical protein
MSPQGLSLDLNKHYKQISHLHLRIREEPLEEEQQQEYVMLWSLEDNLSMRVPLSSHGK